MTASWSPRLYLGFPSVCHGNPIPHLSPHSTCSFCFAMQNLPTFDEENHLEKGSDKGERIGVCLPCINTNHLFQITIGPGRTRADGGGKKRPANTSNSTSTGAKAPTVPASATHSPTSCRLGWSHLFIPTAHRETRFSLPSHTMTCTTVYCVSTGRIINGENPKEQCSLGSPASVRLYHRILTLFDSPVHSFSRKNFLPQFHARAADFSSPGRTPVYIHHGPPFLLRRSVLSVSGVWPRGSS